MSHNFTAEEVRAEAAEVADYGGTQAGLMLTAYADRIEADEMAVPVLWWYPRGDDDMAITTDAGLVARETSAQWMPLFAHPPAQAVQVDGWQRLTDAVRDQQAKHLGNHQGDVYHAMQYIGSKYGKPETRPMIESAPTADPVAQGDPLDTAVGWLDMCGGSVGEIVDRLSTHPHSPDAADSGRGTALAVLMKNVNPYFVVGTNGVRIREIRVTELELEQLKAALAAQGQSAASPVGVPDEIVEKLDQMAIDAAIARCGFQHSHVEHKFNIPDQRRIMAIMYKDGFRAAMSIAAPTPGESA